jgi:hypothetical protein
LLHIVARIGDKGAVKERGINRDRIDVVLVEKTLLQGFIIFNA